MPNTTFADEIAPTSIRVTSLEALSGKIKLPDSSFVDTSQTSWNPSLLTGLVSWWDASTLSSITLNGSNVASWANRVAGGPVAAQGTAANQPAYSATGRNGRPALIFDGTNDTLPFTPTGFPNGSGAAVTIFLVGQIDALAGSTTAFSYGVASNDQSVAISQYVTGSLVRGGTFGRDSTTATVWNNNDHIVGVSVPAGAGPTVVRANGANAGAQSTSGTANLSATNGRIGATVSDTNKWKGAIQEILVFNRALTTKERLQVEGYLAWRWGLVDKLRNGHSFKKSPPGGFNVTGNTTEYEKFLLTESRPEYSVNDFSGASQSDRIKNAVAAVKALNHPARLRIGLDVLSEPATSTWIISEAIKIPSNVTVLLDGVMIKRATGVFDNIARNDGIIPNPADPNGIVSELKANQNIRFIGINGARIEGADTPYTAPHPIDGGAAIPWVGDDYGWRTCNLVFSNVQGLEVGGFTSDKPGAWSMTLAHGIDGFWVHDINFISNILNGDGLDVRNGCRNGRIERITGNTHDDIVAICAAVPFADGTIYPMLPAGYASNPLGDDTYNIAVEDISGLGGAGNVVRAFTSGAQGTSLHHITIKNIRQTGSGAQCVNIGTFSSYAPVVGSLNNITVSDVTSLTADKTVYVTARLEDCSFTNIWNKRSDGLAFDWSASNQNGSVRTVITNLIVGP